MRALAIVATLLSAPGLAPDAAASRPRAGAKPQAEQNHARKLAVPQPRERRPVATRAPVRASARAAARKPLASKAARVAP
jgi:hypothetical protein